MCSVFRGHSIVHSCSSFVSRGTRSPFSSASALLERTPVRVLEFPWARDPWSAMGRLPEAKLTFTYLSFTKRGVPAPNVPKLF